MIWISLLLLTNLLAANALTPRSAILLAEKELSDFPEVPALCSRTNRYKKVTQRSLQMSKRNALMKKALNKLEAQEEHLIDEVKAILNEKFEDSTGCSATVATCSFDSKYRTIDGTCNNKDNPKWGSSGSPLFRLLGSRYGNPDSLLKTHGSFTPSNGNCAKPGILPNARLVSSSFHPDSDVPSDLATHMLTQMGQFLDHDLSLTPESHVQNCCGNNSQDGCIPISIPSNDPFYSKHAQTCLEFTRSEQYCDSSPREQFNSITSYIDASNVYGSDAGALTALRDSNGYLMKVTTSTTGKEFLPKNEAGVYFAGDVRAIEMPGLAAMHTLFVREHNRIAKAILVAFPDMDKNTIFEETRRIVGAEMQNVVYGQYLPSILGPKFMDRYNLGLASRSTYDAKANADISNVFATAAYRFGHSMIQGDIQRLALTSTGSNSSYALKDVYFDMTNYDAKNGIGMEEIIYGLVSQASQKNDRFAIDDVTNHLFNEGKAFGSDLLARNIERGRDHGLPTYGFWRKRCELPELCDWNTKPSSISQSNWNILKTMYASPNDIDVFTAGLAETSSDGSVLGETFSCLIGEQFDRTKRGDRYFFTHKDVSGSFTSEQIANIKTRTLGQIICDNTDIQKVRSNVFRLNSDWISCPSTSTLNLSLFNLAVP